MDELISSLTNKRTDNGKARATAGLGRVYIPTLGAKKRAEDGAPRRFVLEGIRTGDNGIMGGGGWGSLEGWRIL
jgi:hypothetical protein